MNHLHYLKAASAMMPKTFRNRKIAHVVKMLNFIPLQHFLRIFIANTCTVMSFENVFGFVTTGLVALSGSFGA
jgi:hypothetical protein